MFSLKIIDTDLFLDMPMSARLLYYDLAMRADDDGFVSSPKKIQRMVGASDDDFKLLLAKQFIIPFESGVCVIKHWRIHNYIRPDRYTETIYKDEKYQLTEENGQYDLNVIPNDIPMVTQMDTQVRLGKDSIGKDNKKESKKATSYDDLVNSYTNYQELKDTIYEFIKMRKLIKKPLTVKALQLMLTKLTNISKNVDEVKIAVLNQSIENSWQSIYELKGEKNNGSASKFNKNSSTSKKYNVSIPEWTPSERTSTGDEPF
ncbi:phage replication initiation protein [Clostridium sp. Maddingley MBC34-26]|uniref:phage replication initiation protein n=2 Tax=unclassified Clostridium TaxID=2614128 RepID=UPI0025C5F4A6|nr:phage replication initiation protein [Clostridium sp. Maddingley MBC34-26]